MLPIVDSFRQRVLQTFLAQSNQWKFSISIAMRGRALIAAFAQRNPALHLSVPSEPFVGPLNSVDWTDRNKASAALLALTESRDAALLADLRRRALDSLIQMARWRSRGHAYAPFFVLGRVAGMSEADIAAAWERNDPETVVKAARGALRAPLGQPDQ